MKMGHHLSSSRVFAVILAASLSSAGCAVLRAAGATLADGAATKLQDRVTGSGRQQTRQLVDSLMGYAAQSYRKQGIPVVKGTVQTVLHRGESAADSTSNRLLARGGTALDDLKANVDSTVRGSLNEAVQQLVRDNLRLAGAEGTADVHQLSAAIAASLAVLLPRLDSAASRTASNATNAASSQLATQMSTTLRAALLNTTRDIARTAAQSAIEQADRSSRGSWVAKVLIGLGVGMVVALLALAAAWFFRQHQRTREMLDVVTRAVRDTKDPDLKDEIKALSSSVNLEPSLRKFLLSRGYL